MRLYALIPLIAITVALAIGASASRAQTSLAELKAQVAANSQELDEIDTLLSDLDPNRRSAAMKLLMNSDNPEFIARAIEVGLLSSDPRMRAAALEKSLETGGTFTLTVKLTEAEEEVTKIREWLRTYGNGSWDETAKTGSSVFRVGEYDAKTKCWRFLDEQKCAFVVNGERVSLQEWSYAIGEFILSDEGTLEGTFGYNYNGKGVPVPASIRLID